MDGIVQMLDVGAADTEQVSKIPVTQRRNQGVCQSHGLSLLFLASGGRKPPVDRPNAIAGVQQQGAYTSRSPCAQQPMARLVSSVSPRQQQSRLRGRTHPARG